MLISMEVPDQIARCLGLDGEQPSRRALEMLALEGYRSCKLSRGQVGIMLNRGFHEIEQFLYDHKAYPQITAEEVQEDAKYLRRLLAQ